MAQIARIDELDALRGVAIILMIIFHLVFDLAFFYGWSIEYTYGFWYWEGKASAILFMFVSGISSTLSSRPLRRGLIVFSVGLLITAASYFFYPAAYIRFGILHLLGLSMILAPYFKKIKPRVLLITAIGVFIATPLLNKISPTSEIFVPLGLTPLSFSSLDYYPLMPWLGVILLGAATGKTLYPDNKPLLPTSKSPYIHYLTWPGRHSLMIYVIHQPIILTLLYLIYR